MLLLLLQYKGWSLQVVLDKLVVDSNGNSSKPLFHQIESLDNELSQALLIAKLSEIRAGDPFAEVRKEHGFIIEFPENVIESAKDFLAIHAEAG